MPLESSDFPEEVQVAFFMFSLLPDKYDSNSGIYLGKDWSSVEYIFKLYEIDDKKNTFFIMKLYESIQIEDSVEKEKARQEKDKRKAKSGGKNFTHNVRG